MSSLTSTGCSRKRVTLREKEIIIGNFFENNSITQTARVVGRSKSVVSRIVKRYNEENSLDEKKKLGRPLKTDAREDRELVRMAKSDRFQSSRKLASKFAAGISHQTVIRRLGKVGFKSKVAAVKPLISKKNQRKRLEFARVHQTWTQSQWNSIHFSDESKFNVFGNDGQRFVWRQKNEKLSSACVKKSVKFGGGSVMVWGMMSAAGVGPIVRVQGTLNSDYYKRLLAQHVVPVFQQTSVSRPVFMQDNAPCHKVRTVMGFLQQENITVMDWPAQSPDLNPIENVWKMIGERAISRNPKNADELWDFLLNEWTNITPSVCRKLVNSCGRRCAAVIANRGLFTKY